jgi:DNA-binding NarL/FixJ family response regulator
MFRILIADDSDDTRAFVRAALSTRGWTVCGEAANGRQAVLMASQLKPDLVIVDLSMPMLTGLEATREIRRAVSGQKVMLFTLHSSPQLTGAAASVGALKVVSKSDGLSALIAAIEQIVDGSHSSGGSRGDPGGSSGPSLPLIDAARSSTDTQLTPLPGTTRILPHAEPVIAASASASASDQAQIAEPAISEPSISEPMSGAPANRVAEIAEAATGPPGNAIASDGPPTSSQDPQT